jgi:hypothetical protein
MELVGITAFSLAVGMLLSLVALFLWRRAYRSLPLFFVYILGDLLIAAARYGASQVNARLYFYVFWFTEFAGFFTVVFALYEVSLKRLFPQFFRYRFYRFLFPLIAVIVPILSIQIALQAPDKRAALSMAVRGYDSARAVILVFVVTLMIFMGRSWRRYDFGVLLGFAVQAAAAVVNGIVRAQAHYQGTIWDTVETLAFDLSCLIWVITFLKPEKQVELQPLDQTAAETLHQARTWQSALKDWLTPGKRSL